MKCVKCKETVTQHLICDGCVRKSARPLPAEQAAAVRAAMEKDETDSLNLGREVSDFYYLFHDLHVEREDVYRSSLNSRTAQLVSINRDGIPMMISRRFMNIMHAGA